ncbi:MAG: RluA family pseudouridine synthase [Armatimonadetes bacterium]|nr:RluA family pseudouridine synthase [Armatimonadota bacterium]
MSDEPAHQLTVDTESAGTRLDVYLARALPDLSRSAAHRAIDAGDVLVDGQPAKPRTLLRAGQRVSLTIAQPQESEIRPEAIDLRVVYEDADLIVINKPAGMVTHPARGHWEGTLVNALLAHCTDLSGIGGTLRPGIVHRLDRDTTGLLVAAKNDVAHRGLAGQLASRAMKRRYLALVYGEPDWEETVVDAPLGRHPTQRLQQAVIETGRPARTHFRVLARYGLAALLTADLDTGRTHQVRVHATHLGLPLLGDPVYGQRRAKSAVWPTALAEAVEGLPGQALHAIRLSFLHPADGRPLVFECAPPPAFVSVVRQLADAAGAPPTVPWLVRPATD